jgi:hypothetical protein
MPGKIWLDRVLPNSADERIMPPRGPRKVFVSRGGDKVCMPHRTGVAVRGHQAGDMGHIDHELGAYFVGDGPELGKIQGAGVRAAPGHDHGRPMLQSQFAHFVVIDPACFPVHAVADEVKKLAGKVHRAAVGQVPAVA